jgi:hypothetical protein
MGEVLPQYNPATLAAAAMAGDAMLNSGAFTTSTFGIGGGAEPVVVKEGDTNLYLYEAGRPVDLTEVSSAVRFARQSDT